MDGRGLSLRAGPPAVSLKAASRTSGASRVGKNKIALSGILFRQSLLWLIANLGLDTNFNAARDRIRIPSKAFPNSTSLPGP
jgi:hypothetical protein